MNRDSPGTALAGMLWLFVLAGCSSSAPKLEPYAYSTTRMAAGIDEGRTTFRLLLAHAPGNRASPELEQRWDDLMTVVAGIQSYTQTLAGVLDLGDRGSETVRALADGVDTLMSPVGLKGVSTGVVKTAEKMDMAAARVRARKELKEAIAEAHPAVVEIAKAAQRELLELERMVQAQAVTYEENYRKRFAAVSAYYVRTRELEAVALDVLAIILAFEVTGDIERLKELRQKDGVHPDVQVTASSIPQLKAYWHERALFLRNEQVRFQEDMNLLARRTQDIRTLCATCRTIAQRGVVAVQQWAQAHGKLNQAMRKSKPKVNFALFASVVQDLEDAGRLPCQAAPTGVARPQASGSR